MNKGTVEGRGTMETAQFFHFKGLTFFCFLFPPSSFSEAVAKWIEIIAVTFFIGYFQPLWGSSFLVVRLSVAPCKAGGKACCFSRTNHLGNSYIYVSKMSFFFPLAKKYCGSRNLNSLNNLKTKTFVCLFFLITL